MTASTSATPAAASLLERTLTELDHVRLGKLARPPAADPELATLLELATVVPTRDVPPDVVTMGSRIELQDDDGRQHSLLLCYPSDAGGADRVSVLSPVGRSLIGLRIGDAAEWTPPTGRTQRARIVGLAYQPEASGDYLV